MDGPNIVSSTIKYLGLTLDELWKFSGHFKRLTHKLCDQTDTFAGVMPNLHDSGTSLQQAYMHTWRRSSMDRQYGIERCLRARGLRKY